jgi:hypothetical protein
MMHCRALPEKGSGINLDEIAVAARLYQTAAMMRLTVIEASYCSQADFLAYRHPLSFAFWEMAHAAE